VILIFSDKNKKFAKKFFQIMKGSSHLSNDAPLMS